MVKHCVYGLCNSDTRYPERIKDTFFVPFPKPKRARERCLIWLKACGRPQNQLNVDKITRNTYLCSKHFVGGKGPTTDFPNPVDSFTGYTPRARLSSQKTCKRQLVERYSKNDRRKRLRFDSSTDTLDTSNTVCEQERYTGENNQNPLDMLATASELCQLGGECEQLKEENANLKKKIEKLTAQVFVEDIQNRFSVKCVKESPIKGLLLYYTGFNSQAFDAMYKFFVPDSKIQPFKYIEWRNDVKKVDLEEQLFIVLCRLRNGLHIKDLAHRHGLKVQTVSMLFNSWIDYMYLRLGYLCFWPSRDTIISNMTQKYYHDFPSSLAIIDCTELKTEKPSSLKSQSQCYSDYKSSTTIKSLIVIDPRGSVMFVSELFSGSISDKAICQQSGFYKHLKSLIDSGKIHVNDAIMADKGFTISDELAKLGLQLNIPPFAKQDAQFTSQEVAETKKIASHRIHVERTINRIKQFKLVGRKIPLSLMGSINQIWFVCCMLTNFQQTLVQK